MTESDAEILRGLLEEALAGCPHAAGRLHELLGPSVLRAVRRKLPTALRPLFDSQDFAQAAWASFFRRLSELPPPDLARGPQWFLKAIAEHKVVDEVRAQLQAVRRNRNRLISLQADNSGRTDVPSREPSPSAKVTAQEVLDRIASISPDARRVIALRLDGASHAEIAAALGVSERTISRLLRRLEREIR